MLAAKRVPYFSIGRLVRSRGLVRLFVAVRSSSVFPYPAAAAATAAVSVVVVRNMCILQKEKFHCAPAPPCLPPSLPPLLRPSVVDPSLPERASKQARSVAFGHLPFQKSSPLPSTWLSRLLLHPGVHFFSTLSHIILLVLFHHFRLVRVRVWPDYTETGPTSVTYYQDTTNAICRTMAALLNTNT